MESVQLLDSAGWRRSPATLAGFHIGRLPRNKGLRYPPDPPTVEEIVAVMLAASDDPAGLRLRGVIIVLWRAGLRISEALALTETDLDHDRGALLVRHGECRIRHLPCYAGPRVMPNSAVVDGVFAVVRDLAS
jgi:integrase